MADNFHIFKHPTTESLHLQLVGDFDGNSASELIKVLEDNQSEYFQIFINTSNLSAIHSFGKKVFQSRIPDFDHSDTLVKCVGKNIGQS
jgi:hypothetical protein